MLIAATCAIGFPDTNFIYIGFLVAAGSALAKSVHYFLSFFIGIGLNKKYHDRINSNPNVALTKRWAFLSLFVVAATPLPDEPVVIPLGLVKYNPAKFFSAYFIGKLSISLLGAYLGKWVLENFTEWISTEMMIVISIILTVVVTIIMFKVNFKKLAERILKRKITWLPEVKQEKS